MSGTIWLIVEDTNDADVIKAICRARSMDVKIGMLTPSKGGISRLASELEQLIKTAKKKRGSRDCIAVLHDSDFHTQPDRGLYDQITEICKKYKRDVKHIIARDELEAWLLADTGLCQWLGITPRNQDEQRRPSDELASMLQKKRSMKYQGPDRSKVLQHLDGSGDQHSPSMKEAVTHLENAPCMRA